MKPVTSGRQHPFKQKRTGFAKARSVPQSYRKPYFMAVCTTCLHYLCLTGTLTSGILLWRFQSAECLYVMLAFLAAAIATGFMAFFLRRSARCPLCKGSPLMNTGARTHRDAFRLTPLNHGTTAVLHIICCQRFRCMFCGSLYDFHKPLS